jgi:hypothetical protein
LVSQAGTGELLHRSLWLGALLILIAVGFAWHVFERPMDFRVYYFGAEGVFDGTRPVYGESSGMGWPMHYRDPPLFLFLAHPLNLLPLPWAAALWVILKCGVLFLLVHALWKRLGPTTEKAAWLVPLLLAGPYIVEELRYGNAQTFIFALTAFALLNIPSMPAVAAAALALAISIKVWPLYFVPYLAALRHWKTVGWTLVLVAVLLLAPALYFGFNGNLALLVRWAGQELSTQTGASEIWFPSQSLRGVLMRFLTAIDYSQVPDSNYPLVHVATLDPNGIRLLWLVLAAIAYAGLLMFAVREKPRVFGIREAVAFAGVVLLQPFSQKYALVVLLWPAMVAGRLVQGNRYRGLLYAAIGFTLIQPLASGAAAQRLLQVLGFDFLATTLLAAFLLVSSSRSATARSATE